MTLNLEEFTLETLAFELKYAHAYLLWDRAGQIGSACQRQFPTLKMISAAPERIAFAVGQTQLAVSLDDCSVVAIRPSRDLDDVAQVASKFFEQALTRLEVATIARVGTRFVFFRKSSTREEAAAGIAMTGLVRLPQDDPFRVQGVPIYPEFAARFDGKLKGATLRVKAETRELVFDPPPQFERLSGFRDETHGITVDADIYTTSPISTGQFSALDWLHQAQRSIKLAATSLFSGVAK